MRLIQWHNFLFQNLALRGVLLTICVFLQNYCAILPYMEILTRFSRACNFSSAVKTRKSVFSILAAILLERKKKMWWWCYVCLCCGGFTWFVVPVVLLNICFLKERTIYSIDSKINCLIACLT